MMIRLSLFIIDLTIKGAQAVIFSSQKPPKRFRDAKKIQNFLGRTPRPPFCFSFSILPGHPFRLRSATALVQHCSHKILILSFRAIVDYSHHILT